MSSPSVSPKRRSAALSRRRDGLRDETGDETRAFEFERSRSRSRAHLFTTALVPGPSSRERFIPSRADDSTEEILMNETLARAFVVKSFAEERAFAEESRRRRRDVRVDVERASGRRERRASRRARAM